MKKEYLFTDASANPQRKVGVGGYLRVPESIVKTPSHSINLPDLDKMLVLKRFEDTSSTKIEVQTVLWALEDYCRADVIPEPGHLHIYSDSQCVEGLLARRDGLENTGFCSKGGRRQLKNACLYRKYYESHDRLKFDVEKVAGHIRSKSRNTIERIFSFIDQKVRKALKQWMVQLEAEKAEWYLYMIRCQDGSLYTGISNDVTSRFEKHRDMGKQGAKYLRGKGPLKLVFQKKIGTKSAALKMEQKIKKMSKSQKERIIIERNLRLE